MQFFPKAPNADRASVWFGITLALFQIAGGIAMSLIWELAVILFPTMEGSSPSSIGGVAAMVGAMSYAQWVEIKCPGALARRSMILWLAGYATLFSVFISIIFLAVYLSPWLEKPPEIESLPPAYLFAILPIAALLSFLITWFGLWQGRKIAEKQRAKLAAKNTPPDFI